MEIAKEILSLAYDIYCLVEAVKANKKRCQRVSERVKALEGLVSPISQRDVVQPSDQVETALTGLSITLKSAHELIKKYVSANLVKRILKSGSHGDEFNSMNDRLNDAFQSLALALQLEQGNAAFQLFEQNSRLEEDERDRKEDDAEMKRMLLEYAEYVETMQRDLEDIKTSVTKIVEILNKPSIVSVDIRLIKPEELKYNQESFIMETPSSKVYKGQFGGFTVAIKKYLDPLTSPGEVKSIFDTEVDTMKRFESPNILRMFGICIVDENTPKPQYLIIMEYCEKGSLRDVLSSKWELTWTRKACMCLDAAQGLYRLHLTEEKSKVHGNITSSKFLVDANYRVKNKLNLVTFRTPETRHIKKPDGLKYLLYRRFNLGGFELAKTETSLRKITKDKDKDKDVRSSCYSSPQLLNNIHHVYSKECEMYSFGIVLWEIATRKKPFEGCTTDDIHKKVYEKKYQEPLLPDCPEGLGQLINACRSFDSDQRPTTGVLVDKLRSVVVQLELQ